MRIGRSLLLAAILLAGCTDDPVADPPYQSEIYQRTDRWLCHEDQSPDDNVCDGDLDATVVAADGTTTVEAHAPAADPQVDCFYVYPTTSADPETFSDFEPGVEEPFIALNQTGRLNSVCRVFAPIYRQVTVAALLELNSGGLDSLDWTPAYADVADAFKHYLANDNDDRGFVLIGHSQGARHLIQLVQEEIETTDVADRMIAAYLIGFPVNVPPGEDVGATFASTPVCRSADQTGCIVSYSAYRDTEPPVSATSLFGEATAPDTEAVCNSPAALVGSGQELSSYYPTEVEGIYSGFVSSTAYADEAMHDTITTPFYTLPGLATGACVDQAGHQYVEVTVNPDTTDPRADDIAGDLTEGWGLHLVDVHLMMGDLVTLAARQSEAWLAR